MANEKSKAEQYRDERKARIAKAAKKNAKGMEKRNGVKKAVGKVISIILVVAIALGAVGAFLNSFGVWDRTMIIGSVGADKIKVTAAEYEYYYYTAYNNLVNTISQQQSYYGYSSYEFDTTLPPDKQTSSYTDPETGEQMSWDQFLSENAVNQIKMMKTLYKEAVDKGYKLDDADEKTIDEEIQTIRDRAAQMGDGENGRKFSTSAYIRYTMGPYSEGFLRKIWKEQLIVSKYQNGMVDDKLAGYSQEEIDKVYNEDKTAYDFVDFCMYTFSAEAETEDAETTAPKTDPKKDADAFFAAITDEASFYAKAKELNKDDASYDAKGETNRKMMLKSDLSGLSEDAINWLFNAGTKAGSKKLVADEASGSYTVFLLTKPMYQAKTVSVRHILFMTVDQSTGEPLAADKKAEAKQKADDALNKYNSGEKTEDSFAALATELTEDTGSQSTGGLYEDFQFGKMVYNFSEWSYDAARKPGDVGIVETEYGYHVMYFVGTADTNYYDASIRESKGQEEAQTELENLVEDTSISFWFKSFGQKQAHKKVVKKLTTMLQLQSNSANYSY